MIKANELRIGNFVSVNKGFEMLVHSIFQDDTLYLDFIPPLVNEADVWEVDAGDVSPIELTEEWLLKLGFECIADCIDQKTFALKNRKSNYYYAVILDHEEIVLERKDINGFYIIIWDERYFQYVHQLQNIYFALTGEELQLK